MDSVTVLKYDTDSIDIRINLDLYHLRDCRRTYEDSGVLVDFPARRTDSHISVSSGEIKPSQFYVTDILE